MERVDTVVIGAGQAGLAMSYHLQRLGREHVVLERARVAERWRSERWDSLMFQFPNWSIELPGRAYAGPDPDGFSTKDEVLRFIDAYAAWIDAPVRTSADVRALRAGTSRSRYDVVTSGGTIGARNVVIATGPYQQRRLPRWRQELPAGVVQLHAADYRNPATLPPGAVLVVGSGASGCQIADELLENGRRVMLAIGSHRRVPRRYRGRDAFWWRREMGELDQTVDALPASRRMHAPLVTGVHGGYDVDLRRSAARGMTLVGHLREVHDGRFAFAPDAEECLRQGDRTFEAFVLAIDEHVRAHGLDVPLESLRSSAPAKPVPVLEELNVRTDRIGAVIWATGYELDLGWVQLPILDAQRAPMHERGVTKQAGIYLLGLPWLHKAKSSFLYGVGEDAEYIASRIASDGESPVGRP